LDGRNELGLNQQHWRRMVHTNEEQVAAVCSYFAEIHSQQQELAKTVMNFGQTAAEAARTAKPRRTV